MSETLHTEVEPHDATPRLLPASFALLSPDALESLGAILARVAVEAAATGAGELEHARQENAVLKNEVAALTAALAARDAERADVVASLLSLVARLSPADNDGAADPDAAERGGAVGRAKDETQPEDEATTDAHPAQPDVGPRAGRAARNSTPRAPRVAAGPDDRIGLAVPRTALDAIDKIVLAGESLDRAAAAAMLIVEALEARARTALAMETRREVAPALSDGVADGVPVRRARLNGGSAHLAERGDIEGT